MTTDDPSAPTRITSLTGVYHAEGTVRGELAYVVGRLAGRAHCALCDITHGALRERADWRTCRDGLPVHFEVVHLDERSPAMAEATEGQTPAVVAHTGEGIVPLLGPAELDACEGRPEALVAAIEAAAHRSGLTWP